MSVEGSTSDVGSSAARGAVFLSYASQDIEAAKRIADALRGAGVEVWFDQSELVGGDAWDAKIRKQIGSCALLIPMVSASTQARREGYFRLEWRLAVERMRQMDDDLTFLLPVVIDDTRDADARVPAEFKAVQWTRLPGGEAPAAFVARVRKLLGGEQGAGSREPGSAGPGPTIGIPARRGRLGWFIAAAAVLLIAGWIGLSSVRRGPALATGSESTRMAPAAPPTEAQKLTRQAKALLDDDPMELRENFFLADELAQRAVTADPTDGEAWAVAGRASAILVQRKYDNSTARQEMARMQAGRAMSLAPASIESALTSSLLSWISGDPAAAEKSLQSLAQKSPMDWRIWMTLSRIYLRQGSLEQALESSQRAAALAPGDSRPLVYQAIILIGKLRLYEAEQLYTRAQAVAPGREFYARRFLLLALYLYDVPAAKAFLASVPLSVRQEDTMISQVVEFYLRTGESDLALAELRRMPRDFFEDGWDFRPKGYLAGYAHAIAGRSAAAQTEWKQALAVVEKRLAAEPNQEGLMYWRCMLQALTGQREAAREGRKVLNELRAGDAVEGNVWFDAILLVALGENEAAVNRLCELWPKATLGLRTDLWGDFLYAPWFAAIRDDPRIRALAAEHKAAIDAARLPPGSAAPRPAADDKSVAVLAFDDLSEKHDSAYFSDGISEELLNVLAKVPGLKVSARTSAFFFKGKDVPIPEIAQKLGVAYVVEGSVRKQGDKVRITAQLIKAADDFHVWSDTFTRDLKDIFAVQDEIAGLIAKNLQVKMGVAAARPTVDLEAYQEFLAGRALFVKADNNDLKAAVAHFTKAVEIEPKFTAAWVQLAAVHTQLGRWGGTATIPAWAAARAAIDHALELEPDSPDVLLALGWILRTGEWDWLGAERAYRRAMQLRPNHADTLSAAAVLLYNLGRKQEALELGRQAVQLDPLNPATQIDLSLVFYFSQEWTEQEKLVRRALELAPAGVGYRGLLAYGLAGQRRFAEAEAEARGETDEVGRFSALGISAALQGHVEAAQEQRRRLEQLSRERGDTADLQLGIADISAVLGDGDRAFAALNKAVTTRDPSVAWFRNDFILGPLHSDPRWDVLLRQVGLDADQLK